MLLGNNFTSPHTAWHKDGYRAGTASSLVINNAAVVAAAGSGAVNVEYLVPKNRTWWTTLWNIRYRERSRRIDLLSRILFPVCFMLFNITVSYELTPHIYIHETLQYWIRYLRPYMAVQVSQSLS